MKLTHIDETGRPRMVDVGNKPLSRREAVARSVVVLPDAAVAAFQGGDFVSKKGPVLNTAVIAGTMAVKKTADLIPFCHPLPVDRCRFYTNLEGNRLELRCEVAVEARTGVEMEALTGASVAALTVYDMLKALGHDMRIESTELVSKRGGKSDFSRGGAGGTSGTESP